MANTFAERVTRFTPVLDTAYFKQALTAFLERPATEWVGADTIKRPKISMDGAADYSRSEGYVSGNIDVTYGSYTLEFDRGRSFIIDVLDDDEAGFNLYQSAAMEYVRTKEIPEIDATRFARFAARAGTVVESDTVADALEAIDSASQALDDLEVPREQRVHFVSNAIFYQLKRDLQNSGRWSLESITTGEASQGTAINRTVVNVDGAMIIPVPPKRFYDAVETLDGTTAGQEAGGFQTIATTSKAIHIMSAHMPALEAYTKRNVNKVISPEINQTHDAWKIAYRMHQDGIVADNKVNGVYVLKKATAVT